MTQIFNDRRSGKDRRCEHSFDLSWQEPRECRKCFRMLYYCGIPLINRRKIWLKEERVHFGQKQNVDIRRNSDAT